ncbi:MAG: hypothetical protein WAQ08_00660 [Aquabacterium sp.]|uniref:helix-turn-helix transcriptional regulator n=1 Tax=Aquabacterium sp. TaxID=1872578 RepID=UPI003BAE5348
MTQSLGEDRLHEIIGLIYEAAIDPERWVTVMEQVSQSLNAAAITLLMHDFSTSGVADGPPGVVVRTVGFEPAYVANYIEHYAGTNVWVRNEETLAEGVAVTSEMLYPQDKLDSTEFYGDWLRPQHLKHCIGGIIVRHGPVAVKLSALRSGRVGCYTEPELDFYRRLLPHLKRACQINKRLEEERHRDAPAIAASQWAAHSTHMGILTLSDSGQVLAANPRGESLLRGASPLRLCEGKLAGQQAHDTAQLVKTLRHTVSRGEAAHARLGGEGPWGTCYVTMMPAPTNTFWTVSEHRKLVLCLITESTLARRVASARQLMELFTLTPAEARLARAIAQGNSVEDHVRAEGVRPATARTQLQSIFAKTGVSSQRELILRVLTLPSIR